MTLSSSNSKWLWNRMMLDEGWRCLMRAFSATLSLCVGLLLQIPETQAAEIEGAWATNQEACSKIFAKQGSQLRMTADADRFGSGLIIEGNRIRGKVATCTIKTRKQEGPTLHLLMVCSTDVALQNVQFSVKMEGADRLIRIYPGIPELDTPYHRCRV
jgi:hypothetical protein